MGHAYGELAGLGEIQDQRGRGDGGAAQTVQGTDQSSEFEPATCCESAVS